MDVITKTVRWLTDSFLDSVYISDRAWISDET